ncbi:hypothetical protein PR202_ga24359 [Eleusine coracana subsp. coracana]|uniref:Uncharacterized protein n=1 Tax=Eleusine coracana subsp. coracana TaxID=191504 RepID=A0AAV5D8B3_ELECO|nr:hypothetical protein PR202_ga24359 [Eleusine coracana subsp. coracana]
MALASASGLQGSHAPGCSAAPGVVVEWAPAGSAAAAAARRAEALVRELVHPERRAHRLVRSGTLVAVGGMTVAQ